MNLVQESLNGAWQELRRNWIVIWFPFFVAIGMALVFVILFVLFGLTVFGFGGLDRLSIESQIWNMAPRLVAGAGVLGFLGILVGVAYSAGQANMLGAAAAGETVSTGHFVEGIRKYYWRFLGGSLLLAILGIILSVIFFGGLVHQLGFILLQIGNGADPTSILPFLVRTLPLASIGFLLFAVARFFVGMWTKIVVVDDEATLPAMISSPNLVWSNLGTFLLLSILNIIVSAVLTRLGGDSGMARLLISVVQVIWTGFFQLVLFVLYRKIRGIDRSGQPQPEEPTPPQLIV